MEITIYEVYEALQALDGVVDIINENTDDTEVLSRELVDVLNTFSDGEEGSNDVELILQDIRNSLVVYDEDGNIKTTAIEQLQIIDNRLDTEFIVINNAFSLLLGGVSFFIIWTLLGFVLNRIKNL